MSFQVNSNVEFICNQIVKQCANPQLRNRFQFTELISSLGAIERFIVAKYFCRLPWNVGNLHVLHVFQQVRLLSASEYILSIDDPEQLQLILNDFLEDEYDLLKNLFIASIYDATNAVKLSTILEDALRSLYHDLLKSPNINNLDYLGIFNAKLPADVYLKVAHKHVNIVLELHTSNVKEAFRNFSIWINEGVDEINFTKLLCTKLFSKQLPEIVNFIFKMSTLEHFKEWKFYIIFLQTIGSQNNGEATSSIKKYFKARLLQIASIPCTHAMLHLLLSVRAATAITIDIKKNLDAYADWYKQNIAEIKFIVDATKFQNVLNMLEECLSYELEQEYLEIHALITISPPVHCSKLVSHYKAMCKMRLSQLKNHNKSPTPVNPNESIVIDDSE